MKIKYFNLIILIMLLSFISCGINENNDRIFITRDKNFKKSLSSLVKKTKDNYKLYLITEKENIYNLCLVNINDFSGIKQFKNLEEITIIPSSNYKKEDFREFSYLYNLKFITYFNYKDDIDLFELTNINNELEVLTFKSSNNKTEVDFKFLIDMYEKKTITKNTTINIFGEVKEKENINIINKLRNLGVNIVRVIPKDFTERLIEIIKNEKCNKQKNNLSNDPETLYDLYNQLE